MNLRQLVATYTSFTFLGMAATLTGPSLVQLAHRLSISVQQAGVLISIQFFADVVAVLASGFLLSRINARYMFAGAALVCGSGLLMVAFTNVLLGAQVGVSLIGAGVGCLSSTPNAIFVNLYKDKAAPMLNRLNFFYGPGAVIGPLLLGLATRMGNFVLSFAFIGGGLILLSPFLFQVSVEPSGGGSRFTSALIRNLVPGLVAISLYVGFEVGYSSLISYHVTEVVRTTAIYGSVCVALFWSGNALARLVGASLIKALGTKQSTIFGAMLFALATSLLIVAPFSLFTAIGVSFIAGFGSGPVFPNILALALGRVQEKEVGTSLLVSSGALGATVFPLIQVQLTTKESSGMIVPVCAALALVLWMQLTFTKKHPPDSVG